MLALAASAGEHPGLPGAASNSDGGADAGEGDPGALHVAQALKMLELKGSCAHCEKPGTAMKRCSICKEAWYCGAACQKANWKQHKKTCAKPVQIREVWEKVNAAGNTGDWRGVLKWDGRMEELLAFRSNADLTLIQFCWAHTQGWDATGSKHHARAIISLEERRIPLLGNLQRFQDQGVAMCVTAERLMFLDRNQDAMRNFQRARDVGAAHGFFTVESRACRGLGLLAATEGRREEGVALLRNAVEAGRLNELDDPMFELDALNGLIDTLLKTDAIDEVKPLVLRYREVAKAQSGTNGGFSYTGLRYLLYSARLHEVLRILYVL